MAHELKPTKSQEMEYKRANANDDDIEVVKSPEKRSLKHYAAKAMYRVAGSRIGQVIIGKTDRVLRILEETTKWSLPPPEDSDPENELERPLPWLLFIPLIFWLRFIRFWFSIFIFFISPQPVTPLSMLYFIKDKRRQLRELQMQSLKSIQNKEPANKDVSSSNAEQPTGAVESPSNSKRHRDDDSSDLDLTVPELLEKYANKNSDSDSDYVPNAEEEEDDEDDSFDSTLNSMEAAEENPEISSDVTIDADETQVAEIKENGESNQKPNTLLQFLLDVSEAQMEKENEIPPLEKENYDNSELEKAASTEVAPPQQLSAPKSESLTLLSAALDEENQKKSTPDHESAASMEPLLATGAESETLNWFNANAAEKCYRTITTQTSLEIDWSITIKTEITHHRSRPKLENLNYSVQLTPATSDEDIFYSPTGSPQDLESIFHPAPLVKDSTTEAQTSTPNEVEKPTSTNTEATGDDQQRKHFINNSNSDIDADKLNRSYNKNKKGRHSRSRR